MANTIKYNMRLALFFIITIFCTSSASFAQETDKKETPAGGKTEDLQEFMEEGMKEIGYYSLEELLNVQVDVASLFSEDELVVGSMVSSISSDQWKRLGARRTYEALNNELSIMTYWHIIGYRMVAIRGYASTSSMMGTAFIMDGIPLNEFMMGGIAHTPNIGLGALDKIELIKGPGSAIYGSDAFHGVISMKTYESDKDEYAIEGAGAYPLYGDASIRISQGFADGLFRINAAATTSGQTPQDRKYDYKPNDSPGTTREGERDENYNSNTGVFKLNINPADRLKLKIGSYITYDRFHDYPGVALMPNRTTFAVESLEDKDKSSVKTYCTIGNALAVYTFPSNISVEAGGFYWQFEHNAEITSDHYGSVNYQDSKGNRTGANLIIKQPDNPINLQWLIGYSFTYFDIISAKSRYKNMDPMSVMVNMFGVDEIRSFGDANYDDKTRAIHSGYAQTKWGAIKKKLYLIAGGRLDNYENYGNQATPRAGLIFLPAENSSIKALYGRAFRAAIASEMYGISGYSNGNTDLKPETIDIYELILMHKEKKWKAVLNGFYSKWKNGIITEFNNNIGAIMTGAEGPYNNVNKGENESYGGEGSLFISFEPFAIDLGLSYVKSKALNVKRFEMTTLSNEEIEEEYYVAFPEYIANAGLYYTLNPYGVNFYLSNRFYYGMKETHYNSDSDPEDLPLYWRMNLNIAKSIGEKAEFIIDIRNMLNRKNYIPSPYGAKGGYEEPGISVLLRASYKI